MTISWDEHGGNIFHWGTALTLNIVLCWDSQGNASFEHLLKVNHKGRLVFCVTKEINQNIFFPVAQRKNYTLNGAWHLQTPIHVHLLVIVTLEMQGDKNTFMLSLEVSKEIM